MLTTDLGACEWFVWDLRRSNLIDRGQLDQVIGEFLNKNPGSEPPALAQYLVAQGILTEFQADRLLQGKTQGFVLGPFTLMDSLGSGSMGTVYKALSKTDNKWYAIKVLPRRSMWNVRIARRKVRTFDQCKHPAVVPFVDVGTSGGMHYLAWPFVEGEPLDQLVQREGPLAAEVATALLLQVTEGLEVCHQHNLFHGMLKPSNLMLGPDGQVRILDFGIGCLLAETEGESLVDTMSTANSVNSGLDCASPESIMDPTNLNTIGDQYSLGCVLYYWLSGTYPFPEGTAVEKMMAHQHKQPTPIKELAPETPDEVIAIVERLMQKLPEKRYPSCVELIEALRGLTGQHRGTSVVLPRPKLVRPEVRHSAGEIDEPELPDTPEPPALRASSARPSVSGSTGRNDPASRLARLTGAERAPAPNPNEMPADEEMVDETETPAAAPDITDDNPEAAPPPPLGTVGVVLLAVLAGVIAYALSFLIQF